MPFQKIIPWIIILVLSSSCFSTVEAGGREKPESPGENKRSASILVNSWYRNNMIQAALANITGEAQTIKTVVGVEELQFELFASQTMSVPARSIAVVYFPVISQKTSRGVFKDADHVAVYGPDGSLIDLHTVQKTDPSRPQLIAEHYLAASGDGITISYDLDARQGLSLVFVPKSLQFQGNVLISGSPREGSLPACSKKDLDKLGLPDEYGDQARAKLANHHGFIVKDGEQARIIVDYAVLQISDCAVVRLSDYQYFFAPDGSASHGAGPGALVMVYNPSVMKIAPLLPLVQEGQGGGKKKMK